MNKKQKILTVAALAIFSSIIFFHYYSINYESPHEQVEDLRDKTRGSAVSGPSTKYISTDPNAGEPVSPPPNSEWPGRVVGPHFDPSKPFDVVASPSPAPPKKKMTIDEFQKRNINWFEDNYRNWPVERVIVEYPGRGWYLDSDYPGIGDVRMPLFLLAVFYVGLFFILKPSATKN